MADCDCPEPTLEEAVREARAGARLVVERDNRIRELALRLEDHLTQVATLRGLLVVERDMAGSIIEGNSSADSYLWGRVAAYDLAIRAIDDRWPDLG